MFPLDVWQEQISRVTITQNIQDLESETSASRPTKAINTIETPAIITPINSQPIPTLTPPDPRNWRNAFIIGGLISGALLIGFISIIGPQIRRGQSGGFSIQQTSSLSKSQAVDLVNRWIQAKREMFAPPYNRQLGAELTTAKVYEDNFGAGGSVEWLEENGAYYRYGVQKIDSVEQFFVNASDATIEVIVTEERTLYKKDGSIDRENTSLDTRLVRYTLQAVNGQWKIADYKTVKVIQKS